MAVMKSAFEYTAGVDFDTNTQFRLHTVHAHTQGHSRSVWKASLKDKASGYLLVRALAVVVVVVV